MCLSQQQQQQAAATTTTTTSPSEERLRNPLETANFVSKLLFLWGAKLLELGFRRPLEEFDLWALSTAFTSACCRDRMEHAWTEDNLFGSLLADYLKHSRWAQIMLATNMSSRIGQSIALGFLIEQFAKEGSNSWESYIWVAVLVGCGTIGFFAKQQQIFCVYCNGMQTRAGLVAAIYAKSLRLSSISGSNSATAGEVTNLASNDVERFLTASVFGVYFVVAPFEAVVILCIGIYVIGWSFLAGYALIVMMGPLQVYFGKQFATIRSTVAAITDERVSLVSQAIYGVRVMKMNAWENQFESRIANIRAKESKTIFESIRYKAMNEAISFCSSTVIAVVVFAIHVHMGGVLTPGTAFTILSLLNLLQYSMMKHVPNAVMTLSECLIAARRLRDFFNLSELPQPTQQQPGPSEDESTSTSLVLSLEDVTCYWNFWDETTKSSPDSLPTKEEEFAPPLESSEDAGVIVNNTLALQNISLSLEKNKLYCVVGKVASGKSALLQCIAGELYPSTGRISRNYRTMSYAPQEPWIMDGSVRENVVFGLEFRLDWYMQVLEACGLVEDIGNFLHGDRTVVGDRGIQCSGGQRARIGLARAMYRDADVLLLDDPLSAVDTKVARWIYYSAIHDLALKRGKCVVLATHQHQFVDTGTCILMNNGEMLCCGSYADCVAKSEGLLKAALQTEQQEQHDISTQHDLERAQLRKRLLEVLEKHNTGKTVETAVTSDDAIVDEVQKEKRDVGLVKAATWAGYFQAMGGSVTCILLFIIISSAQVLLLGTIVAIGKWAEMDIEDQDSLNHLALVMGLSLATIVSTVGRAQLSLYLFIKASQNIHDRMTRAVLRSKIEFFDTNPLGRILNRFSADVGISDEMLPITLFTFTATFLISVGGISTAIVVLPFIAVTLPPLFAYFLMLRRTFVKSTREIKRLEGMSRSPIFAMMGEALNGVAVIRTNNGTEFFQRKFEEIHNTHTRAFFAFIAASLWFSCRLDSLALLLMSMASTLAVLFHDQGWFDVDPAVLGLALTLLLQIAGTNFPWMIRQSAEVTNQMISVERILEYASLAPEAPLIGQDDENEFKDWPGTSTIEADNLTVRYRENLPPALSGVSFRIDCGRKVGIVGRTGSGKSSLVQALFRLLEAEDGSIKVDNVDISKLGLHKLRSSMSVIPQSPVLFSGCTVRENLDPFESCSDDSIFDALQSVQMMDAINDLPNGLDYVVAEGGSNFSVGQRQLLCLARAMLQKTGLLVLDEPTANVDSHTDNLLQQAVKKCFEGATILAVAHRLDTVIDYDLILVLGYGKVLEFGSPKDLLQIPNGHFVSMVEGTGEKMSKLLRTRAGIANSS